MCSSIVKALATAFLGVLVLSASADPAVLASLSTGAPSASAPEVVILDYHSFLGNGKSSMDYSDDDLGVQLDRIASMGYRFVALADAIAGRVEGRANVAITIDDGNHSVYKTYKRVFSVRGIKPDLFIYPSVIDREKHSITLEQLRELAAAGCGIHAHGYYHEYMTPKAYAKDPKKVLVEVERPGPALEKMLGFRPRTFAYPFGVGSPEAKAALAAAGYAWAFLADDKVRPVAFADPELDRFAVPRTIVYRWNRAAIMKALEDRLRN
jgi:peptidoglycan/xylan/chitin deacetylase (PgdA/CDA1 family)